VRTDHEFWIAVEFECIEASCGKNARRPGSVVLLGAKLPNPTRATVVVPAINTSGQRKNLEIAGGKPGGRVRVACVVNAVAFGDRLAPGASFEAWMLKDIRARAHRINALIAGKTGPIPVNL
jgi:hypothetical protein